MEQGSERKRSRTRAAVWFLLLLVCTFVVVVFALVLVYDTDEVENWSDLIASGKKIGVVPIEGTITSSDTILKQLRKFRKRSSVKAVLLRINSPGGAVAPAQEIYREIERTRQTKPVIASIETVGASGVLHSEPRGPDRLLQRDDYREHRRDHDAC